MRSMTAFAELVRPLESGQLRLSLRSVNHKALDLSLRMPPALFPLEADLRSLVRGAAQRGKLDLTLEVQDEPSLEPRMNRALLRAVAKAWQEDAEWLHLPPLTAEAFFRLPGAFQPPTGDLADRLADPVRQSLEALLACWNEGREQEAERLRPFFTEGLGRLRELRDRLGAEAEAQAAELPHLYRQRLQQLLEDARISGQLPEDRLLAEAALLAERQDVREELTRLSAHLDDFGDRLATGRVEGKAVDIWCQEVLRELNTTGSKCKRISMTRAVMEAKGVLDQIREQAANLE